MTGKITKYEPASDYTLRNAKVFKEMSEETVCFHASIYLGNKHVGWVKNQGQGGCNSYDFNIRADEEAFEKTAKALPPYEYNGKQFKQDMDGLADILLAEFEGYRDATKYFTYIPEGKRIEQSRAGFKTGRKKVKHDDPNLERWLKEDKAKGISYTLVSKDHWGLADA